MRSNHLPSCRRQPQGLGFTLIELLVVIIIIGVLASLVLPVVAKTKHSSNSASCINNLKQLQVAWMSYADDHNDILPPNNWRLVEWSDGCPQGYPAASGTWVLGDAPTAKTDIGIRNGVLYPYVKAPGVYHCPADKSKLDGNRHIARKRSYSASFYMNGNKHKYFPQVKSKYSEIREPSKVFVFLDEHENSIDDGIFFIHCPGDVGEQAVVRDHHDHSISGGHWMDMPADRHNRGCNFSFADGRAEPWKWHFPKKPLHRDSGVLVENSSDFHDIRRLQACIPDIGPEVIAQASPGGHQHP